MTYPPPPSGPYGQQPGYPQQGYPPQGFPPPYQQQQPQYAPPPPQYPPSGGIPQQTFPSPGPGLPPPKPRSNVGSKVVIGVVVAGIIGAIVLIAANWGTSAAAAEVGDCVKVVSAEDADLERIDCGAQEAVYKVAKKLDSSTAKCPAGDYTELRQSKKTSSMKLCMTLNFKEGECFKTTGSALKKHVERVACGSSATDKVTKVLTGTTDEKLCPRGSTKVATYAEPASTICIGKP